MTLEHFTASQVYERSSMIMEFLTHFFNTRFNPLKIIYGVPHESSMKTQIAEHSHHVVAEPWWSVRVQSDAEK